MKNLILACVMATFTACSGDPVVSQTSAISIPELSDNPSLEEYTGPVVAILKWDIKDDVVAEFKEKYWPAIVQNGRQEKTNISVSLFQSLEDPSIFKLYGEWVNKEAFFEHLETSRSVEALQGSQEYLENPPVVEVTRKLSI